MLPPDIAAWTQIDAWLDQTADAGEHLGVTDLLIAAIAGAQDATLWSLDHDFARTARLGFLELHQPV